MSDELDLTGMTDREILLFLAKTVPGRLSDHGKRLRALETFRNWSAGVGTVVCGLLAAAKLNLSIKQSP